MMHYLLFYEKAPDYIERQAPLQAAHTEYVFAAFRRGDIKMAGNLSHPDNAAMILFESESPAVAEEFAKNDPYVIHGVVQSWHVRHWDTISVENIPKK